jgi:peptidyl-prolyl cis-trans isomerase SurA
MLASFGAASIAHAEVVERIVAIVNDEIITMSDMNKYMDRLRSGGLVDDMLVPDEATRESLLKDRDKLLQKMIEERVIDSEVKKQNLSVPIEKVESEIRAIAKKNNVTRDELKAALAERGVSFSQYQDFIKTGLERQALIEKSITSRIKVSEDDVISAYALEHGSGDSQAFEYTISHIFFSNDKGGSKAAKERADKVLKTLRDGGNFEKIAADTSEDPGFEQGGLLGVFKTGELQKELEEVVSKLNTGEFSAPLPTRGGYHIVKVNKKRLIPDPRTEKEREKIRGQLYEKTYKKQFQSWLEQLRQDAFVRINQ